VLEVSEDGNVCGVDFLFAHVVILFDILAYKGFVG
jgi:uncharacterized protein YuzE